MATESQHFSDHSIKQALKLAKTLFNVEYQNVGYLLRDMPRSIAVNPSARSDWELVMKTLTTEHA